MGTLPPCSVDFEIITSPLSSLITTPDPDLHSLGSKAALKFIRIKGSMGGIHFEMAYFLGFVSFNSGYPQHTSCLPTHAIRTILKNPGQSRNTWSIVFGPLPHLGQAN
ncbi:hypothetical protein ES319_D10G229800v1 [Gossypium barbadense]|uniref:Uncharacterized protein n=1 Tax=Gossypium barbadense TaxID=3634 RepID=A0A5J5PUS7_GOSBA|nr:hypothetical protein ES319_D10G229800v1 [Gossypium barbadense]